MDSSYDLISIGAGAAGLTAAKSAVQFGARTALVEKSRTCGDCTWTGCVPSKTLIKTARVAHQMRTAHANGLTSMEPEVDLKKVMGHVRDVVLDIYQPESPQALQDEGIEVFMGSARFIDPHTITVGDTILKARSFLLSTGARPYVPPIPGLDAVDYLTYESVWDLEVLPRHLLILGAGPIGCEMAQAFRRLGSDVTLVEGESHILAQEGAEVAEVLTEVFTTEGINLHTNAMVERVFEDGNGIHLMAGGDELVGDALLVVVGRRPNVEGLDLEQAGVAYSPKGIQVDDNLRTSERHIYAAGDCTGSYQFTHYAGWQAFMAARNALLPGSSKGVAERVPWAVFTDPEVAHVGISEEKARARFGDQVMTYELPMDQVDRARIEGDTSGFIKLVCKKNGKLLGATIVAGRAGEMIQEWILALEKGVKIGDLASTIHVYPTYTMANMQAAADIIMTEMMTGASGRVIRSLTRLPKWNLRVPSAKPREVA